jgi:hypothetical protein
MRKQLPPGAARDRVDRMIELNDQTTAAIRRSLRISEQDLSRCKE